MKKYIAILLLLLSPSLSLAEDYLFTWDPPTVRTDGSPIDPTTDIKSYKFYRASGIVAATLTKPSANEAPRTNITWGVPLGTNNYYVTAIDQNNKESAASEVQQIILTATPTPVNTPTMTPTPVPPLVAPSNFIGVPAPTPTPTATP